MIRTSPLCSSAGVSQLSFQSLRVMGGALPSIGTLAILFLVAPRPIGATKTSDRPSSHSLKLLAPSVPGSGFTS